ncbi:MAG: type II toxin-antitoxin system RnlA family toxin [Sulfuricurvum sp.]|nr:type II toxin-antitoxin system RnlA family toxin [Sulfuricurvum sp.]
MSLKNLNLNQSNFDNTLNQYPNVTRFTKDAKDILTQYSVYVGEKKALLNVYFNGNGTTSLNPKVGQEQELSIDIANFLKDNLLVADIAQASFSIKNISDEEFSLLKEYLHENAITEESVNNVNGIKLQFTSPYKDTMTVTRYNNGNTLFQGKPLYVFSEIKIFLIDILDFENVIDIENEVYKVSIRVDEINEELMMLLSKSSSYLCETTRKMLSSALTFKKVDIALPDYTPFAFPALRAMEGYLKKSLMDKGISICATNGFNHFDKQDDGSYTLKSVHTLQINCANTTRGIEKCYNFFNKNRHSLFHTAGVTSTTRILTNKDQATRIVDTVFKLIEETYCERLSS